MQTWFKHKFQYRCLGHSLNGIFIAVGKSANRANACSFGRCGLWGGRMYISKFASRNCIQLRACKHKDEQFCHIIFVREHIHSFMSMHAAWQQFIRVTCPNVWCDNIFLYIKYMQRHLCQTSTYCKLWMARANAVVAAAADDHSRRDGTLLKFVHHSLRLSMAMLSLMLRCRYSHSHYSANNFHLQARWSIVVFVVAAVQSFAY